MIKYFSCLILFLFPHLTQGEIIIRTFTRSKPVTVVFTPLSGDYFLSTAAEDSLLVKVNEPVIITRYNNKVIYKTIDGDSQVIDSVLFRPLSSEALFLLRAPGKKEAVKTLDGRLLIKSFPGSLLILNITETENYLPGVVRAEAGSRGPLEYFRTQAVVARTYAYRHDERHSLDGYNLCDDTHCQVYPGIISDSVIIKACSSTAGKVLVDKDSILIISAFHGNCGGQTASSKDVWVTEQPYLVSIADPYCTSANNSRWEKPVTAALWQGFLRSKGIDAVQYSQTITASSAQAKRTRYYMLAGKEIPNEDIRLAFNLKSSFFTVIPVADSVVIKGRGYGHGVGLCQDGARVMAARGKTFKEITLFYYPGTVITDIKNARKPERP